MRHLGWRLAVLSALLLAACAKPPVAPAPGEVRFASLEPGVELRALLSPPAGPPPYPAVVMLHGCSGLWRKGKVSGLYREWAAHLNAVGYAVLMVDSAGARGFGQTCGPGEARRAMHRGRPKDAYAALLYLQARDYVRPDRVALAGWSQGGATVLLSIGERSLGRPEPKPRHDFRAAVAFYPGACSDRQQSRPFTDVAPGTWTTEIPLLVLQGEADNWTRAGPCVAFVEAARKRGAPVSIETYPGAVHAFDAPDLPLRARHDVRTASGHRPLVGTDPAARRDAFERVPAFLAQAMGLP
jgi:dienelactone hydrolase